jgi:hypothetical protein
MMVVAVGKKTAKKVAKTALNPVDECDAEG